MTEYTKEEKDLLDVYPDLIKLAIQVWGDKAQLVMLMEEASEVIQAASKIFRMSMAKDRGENIDQDEAELLLDDLYEEICDFMVVSQQFTNLDPTKFQEFWAESRLKFVLKMEEFLEEEKSRMTRAALTQGIDGVDLEKLKQEAMK